MMLINATMRARKVLDLGGDSAVQYMCVTFILSILRISRTENGAEKQMNNKTVNSSMALEFFSPTWFSS